MKLTKTEETLYNYLEKICKAQLENGSSNIGCTTIEIAQALVMQRSNVSAALNKLYDLGKIIKIKGKPIIYTLDLKIGDDNNYANVNNIKFDILIGAEKSLKKSIKQAQAAILYPPHGLHTLLVGDTGVGKTMFAELMYKFAIESGVFKPSAAFMSFNCADYANNPQLLLTNLFGSKKGSYTGANKDESGVVERANGGILFLDEVHRLPPEGQEMLFYLMDKGIFSRLGDASNKRKSEVLIICATTENVDKSLLSTFTRRIPMCIEIPSISNRSFEERFQFICEFFKIESKRIGKEIIVSTNSLRCLLLYNCPGNIGQLKSDIQLGCANAFLKSVSQKSKNIEIFSTDFPNYVKQGLLFYKTFEQQINDVIKDDYKLSIKPKGKEIFVESGETNIPKNFYEELEKRTNELRDRGLDERDINVVISMEIDNQFKKYIGRFENNIKREELSKIVNEDIIDSVDEFLKVASDKLGRFFTNKVFYGLALHLSSTIERLKDPRKIRNHSLKEIVSKKSEEYKLSLSFARKIGSEYHILIDGDEIDFISMFLTSGDVDKLEDEGRPIVIVAMHGKSTATSMAEVSNALLGEDVVFAYDMNLDKNPNEAYLEIKELIKNNNKGCGALLLVDMGSLGMFGELMSDETGIEIKTIDMVSTSIVIECGRKSLNEKNLTKLWQQVKDYTPKFLNKKVVVDGKSNSRKNKTIITVCMTGEGSAIKLKNIIDSKYNLQYNDINVINLSQNDNEAMKETVKNLLNEKDVLAIVGSINPNIFNIPFVSISDIFSYDEENLLSKIIKENSKDKNNLEDIFSILREEMTNVDANKLKEGVEYFFYSISKRLGVEIKEEVKIGLLMHISSTIEKILNNLPTPKCIIKDRVLNEHSLVYNAVGESSKKIEENFNIEFSADDKSFIARIILEI